MIRDVPKPERERLASIERGLHDIERRIDEHVRDAEDRSDRLRELEAAVKMMVQAHRSARDLEDRQYRRLEARVAIATIMILLAEAISTIMIAVVK